VLASNSGKTNTVLPNKSSISKTHISPPSTLEVVSFANRELTKWSFTYFILEISLRGPYALLSISHSALPVVTAVINLSHTVRTGY
jgi:hypothetical protein